MGESPWCVEEGEAQLRSLIEVRGRCGYVVFLKHPEGVRRGVMDVQVSQGESRCGGSRKYNLRRDRASVV